MDQDVKLMNNALHHQNYIAISKLSEGSYGEIFLVQHKESGVKYVLKALEIEKLKKQFRIHEAFIESLILRKLIHPGIIKIYETIKTQKFFIEILEYCPNGDLFSLMVKVNHEINLVKRKRQIMVFYLSQILEAISCLHEKKIVHRDLKPENIVISEDLHIKIIDFGTALINNDEYLSEMEKQLVTSLKTQQKELVGSAHYLSPEALKLQYSEKSDIWAFGVIAYKFYHNSFPFIGSNNYQIFKSIKEKQPEIEEDIPFDIKQVIEACLKKNPEERPCAKMLKNYSYFKKVKFSTVFDSMGPIQLRETSLNPSHTLGNVNPTKKSPNQELFSAILEKKMFFGNYKPRIFSLYRKGGILYFAYKYVDTKITKYQRQLNMNDYCQKLGKNQMQMKFDDKHYVFRCHGIQCIEKIIEEANSVIRQHFKLD